MTKAEFLQRISGKENYSTVENTLALLQEISGIITNLSEEEKKLDNKLNEIICSQPFAIDNANEIMQKILQKKAAKNLEEYQKTEAEYVKVLQEKEQFEMYQNCLISIYDRYRIEETVSALAEIFQKYAGKRVGEKTKAKISAELAEKANSNFYFLDYSSDGLSLYIYRNLPKTNKYIDNSLRYHVYLRTTNENGNNITYTIFDTDGKLKKITKENFNLCEYKVPENLVEYVENKQKQVDKINSIRKQLEQACNEYNGNNLFEMKYIRKDDYNNIIDFDFKS